MPDEDTVPSQLQQMLQDAGFEKPPRVYNFGRGTFYSTQERLLFDKLVTLGASPDLVIFLDGLNEFFYPSDPPLMTLSWTQRTEQRLAHPVLTALRTLPVARLASSIVSQPVFIRVQDGAPAAVGSAGIRKADGVIRRYAANMRIIGSIAAANDIAVLQVWQPIPLYKYDLRHHTFHGDFGNHELSRAGYPRMGAYVDENPPGDDFLWCADIQEGLEDLLYVDLVHYSPEMSGRVARCIADRLEARVGH